MATTKRPNRKEDILQALAAMLQSHAGQRITTAALAAQVGVSEAALYRHFPSKARMFEGLIDFIEDTLLSRINAIVQEHKQTEQRIELIMQLLLIFAERNPGICRILTGDALQGEQERLQERTHDPRKMWKYNEKDFAEAKLWKKYMKYYEDCFHYCNKVPWQIIPSDQNLYKEYLIANTVYDTLKKLNIQIAVLKIV